MSRHGAHHARVEAAQATPPHQLHSCGQSDGDDVTCNQRPWIDLVRMRSALEVSSLIHFTVGIFMNAELDVALVADVHNVDVARVKV